MSPPLVSVIIPTYNHAQFIGDAIAAALAQTVPVEVIVVDDGSTDHTAATVLRFTDPRVRYLQRPHEGVCAARNAGIDAARGEFVQFLDADDVIVPHKVAAQLSEFAPEVGWVLSDGMIEDEATGRRRRASEQYGYAQMELGGWIQPLLRFRNFIPTFSPLVRRSAIDGIRFHDSLGPEDWAFWHELAGRARVRYVPQILGTYRHRRTGRSRLPRPHKRGWPTITDPLRLNLGCGVEGAENHHPLAGFVNLDASSGWRFEDGLGDFMRGSVSGISISHALECLPLSAWPAAFAEFARVLEHGGVIRITEAAREVAGVHMATLVRRHLEAAGLSAFDTAATETLFRDRSLVQTWHGAPPSVFHIEGVRQSMLFLSPHFDDEALFGSFTVLRHRPRVIVCFPSERDYGTTELREAETREALGVLGGTFAEAWDGTDLVAKMRAADERYRPARVWAPDAACSHPQHQAVAAAAAKVFAGRLTTYHTYRDGERVRSEREVEAHPEWVETKLRALLRYRSQVQHPRVGVFFLHDQREYYGSDL